MPDAAPENEPRPPSGFRSDGLPEPVLPELPTRSGENMTDHVTRKCEIYLRAKQALHRVEPYQAGQATRRQAPTWDYQSGYSGGWRSNRTELNVAEDEPTAEETTEELGEETSQTAETPTYADPWAGYQHGGGYYRWDPWWSSGWSQQGSDAGSSASIWQNLPEGEQELFPDWVQGWYLIQDANLTTHERNLIYTALKQDFSLQRVAQELRTQWPEADLKRHDQHHRPSGFMGEDLQADDWNEDEDGGWEMAGPDLNEEGMAMMAAAQDEAEAALAAIQTARKTLKEARAKQHSVRMSRQYFKTTSSSSRPSSGPPGTIRR